MKRMGLLMMMSAIGLLVFGQTKHTELNELSFVLPVMYNKTTVTNVYGPTRSISGTGISYGSGIQYKRTISRNIYVKLGVGFFAQNFSLRRPYNDDDFVALLRTTRSYSYYCLERQLGLGYSTSIKNRYVFDVSANYHMYNSFRQRYSSRDYQNTTITKYQYRFASMVSLMPSLQRKLSETMAVSGGLILPLYTSWKKDPRFDENRNDRYGPSVHIGIQLGVHYRF